jgi:hypothetical protein
MPSPHLGAQLGQSRRETISALSVRQPSPDPVRPENHRGSTAAARIQCTASDQQHPFFYARLRSSAHLFAHQPNISPIDISSTTNVEYKNSDQISAFPITNVTILIP